MPAPKSEPPRIVVADPADADARYCLDQYFRELDRRMATGYDPARALPARDADMRPPAGLFLLAYHEGAPAGCGALKHHDGWAEVKRMWVSPAARGLGFGRRLLNELERHAVAAGATIARLDSNAVLAEAIALYRSAGYVEVPPFNDEPHADHWFEKRLVPG